MKNEHNILTYTFEIQSFMKYKIIKSTIHIPKNKKDVRWTMILSQLKLHKYFISKHD